MHRFLVITMLPAVSLADGLGAQLSATEIGSDETVQLTITLTRDTREPLKSYLRPDFKDFDVLHQGHVESPQWTAVPGQVAMRSIEQFIYLLRPRHKGACHIPPAMARIGGGEVRSDALQVRVHAPQPKFAAADAGAAPTLPPPPEAMRGDEDLYVDARASAASVFLGEPVVVSWYLYSQTDVLHHRCTVEPRHEDFWSEELYAQTGPLSWDRAEVHGHEYQVALLVRRALFPLKVGRLVISPLEEEATTLQTELYNTASATRASRAISIEVEPLPAAGRPDGFDPVNVGHFELAAAVDKTDLKAGESLTLTVTAAGVGNIHNLHLPRPQPIDGFRVYEPTVTEHIDRGEIVRGQRTARSVLTPEHGGDLVVPSLSLVYFFPQERRYEVATTSPIAVHVAGNPGQLGRAPVEGPKENVLKAQIRPLRNVHHIRSRVGERVLRGPLLTACLAAPPGALLLTLLGNTIRLGLARETAGRRRRRARAGARRRLRDAEAHIKGQRPSPFFGECARALYEHLEYRLGIKCEALTLSDLKRLLIERGFEGELTELLVNELESSDFARFAPSASGPGEMRAALRRVRSLLGGIEQASIKESG